MRKKDIFFAVGAVCMALILCFTQFDYSALETGAWGLSFQQEGQPPSGPASTRQLSQYDAAFLGDTQEKVIYLTFDAGYENGNTAKILDVLKAQKVPAAFFLMNGFQIRGILTAYDSFVIVVVTDGKQQVFYKHAISTIAPMRPLRCLENR